MITRLFASAVLSLLLLATILRYPAFADQPLITDDTGTQGKGKFQLELGYLYSNDRQMTSTFASRENTHTVASTLTYGIVDTVDIAAVLGYRWDSSRIGLEPWSNVSGLTDSILSVKWRFIEHEGLSFAVKPLVVFPTGNSSEGLGAGRVGCGILLIATRELEPFAFHANAAYIWNNNDVDERKDIWILSAAVEWKVAEKLKLVADVGARTDTNKLSSTAAAYVLGGLVYSICPSANLDVGIKAGLTKPEPDATYTAGITVRW